jgi:hypothetical protein
MDWTKIGTALLLGAMLIFLFPRMRHAIQHAPKGSTQDWLGYLMIIAIVGLFVMLLIMMV